MLRRVIFITLAALMLLMWGGCGQNASEELTFVERSNGEAAPAAEQQRTDQVEISGVQQRTVKLLILPFINASRDPDIDLFIRGLPEVIKQLFEADRFIEAFTIDQKSYSQVAERAGWRTDIPAEVAIAEVAGGEYKADLVLCGRIRLAVRSVVIEPKLLSFNGGSFTTEDLSPMEVHLSNFMRFVNPLTEKIRDHLSERQR